MPFPPLLEQLSVAAKQLRPVEERGQVFRSWSPTYTNLTVGNGTVTARYYRVETIVTCEFELVLGSTSSVGSGPRISAPITPSTKYTTITNIVGISRFQDDSGGVGSFGYSRIIGGADIEPVVYTAGSTYVQAAALSSTIPFTWATSDQIIFNAVYETSF